LEKGNHEIGTPVEKRFYIPTASDMTKEPNSALRKVRIAAIQLFDYGQDLKAASGHPPANFLLFMISC